MKEDNRQGGGLEDVLPNRSEPCSEPCSPELLTTWKGATHVTYVRGLDRDVASAPVLVADGDY